MRNSGYEYFHGDFCSCIRAAVKQNRKQKYRINRYDYFGFFPPVRLRLVWQSCQKAEISVNIRSLLVGDVLSITKKEIGYLVIIFIVTILFWITCFNWLNAICIHRALAKSKRIPVQLMDYVFAVLVALIVMLSIKWVGILIINALLILPAASSRNLSVNMREYHVFSIIFSVFSGVMGLILSYYTNVATAPMIVIIASVIYFVTYFFGRKWKE